MYENREEALSTLIEISEQQGYLTYDDIIDNSDKFSLPIQDVDWLSNSITIKGIIIYDERPSTSRITENDEFDDFAHGNYDIVFKRVIELDESLKPFIDEVKSIMPPQYREIAQLKYQVKEGNQYARDRMVEMHLRMAIKIAVQRTEAFDLDIADAISCACIGLITAVDKYDPDSFGAFGSYAALWIQQLLGRESPTQRPLMYYPVHKKEGYYMIYPIMKQRGCLQCGDIDQCRKLKKMICNKLECSNEQAEDIIGACMPFETINTFMENTDVCEKHFDIEGFITANEFIVEDDLFEIVACKQLKKHIAVMLADLKEKEREIIIARYGLNCTEGKTLEEIGGMYGVTRERIRQIETKVLQKLRNPIRSKRIQDFY